MISPKARAVLTALTPAHREELRRVLAAKVADRPHHLSPNALFAAWVAQDLGAAGHQAPSSQTDAGRTVAQNPCISLELTHEQIDREADARLADLKRRRPWDFQRDEEDYPQDDSDISQHERTTTYPWGATK